MDSFTFRRHLQELADNYTRKELLIMAEELNIPIDNIGELSQFELASVIGKFNAITEMNSSNLEALGDRTKTIELTVEEDEKSQLRVEKEIEKGRVIEFTAGNSTFTSSVEGNQIVYRNESGETLLEFTSQSEDSDVEKGLPITNVTLRKGSFRNQQDGFLNRFLASLKGGSFGFQPSGPLGFEAFMADRDRIGRLRAINKEAQNLAYQYEESKLAALQKGEITNEQEADQLVLDYLSKAKTIVELDVFNKALKERQINDLKTKLDNANENQKASIQREIDVLEKDIAENVDTVEKVRSLDQLPAGS
jgi:polyhydroxyalkanoate synthesis regulator phasin